MTEKVALVNPPFSRLVYGDEYSIKSITPCLGLFYIEAYCRSLADFKIFEGEFYETNHNLIREINAWSPDIIGVTTNTSTYPLCVEIAKETSAEFTIAGGPYSSFRVEETLRDGFDAVFIGDAEIGFRQLLTGLGLADVSGCAYLDESGSVIRNPPSLIRDLDQIPFPDHSLMQLGRYQASPHREMREPFATMMTTRGCGFSCSFCLSASGGMNEGMYRERSVDNVIDEVELLVNVHGVKSIQFWDDTFTMRRKRVMDLCSALRKYDITYICNTRTDKIDDEIASALYASGCRAVFFGVESGDEEILATNISKGVENSHVSRAVLACQKIGIQTTISFIIGSIDDTKRSIENTIEFAISLDADYVLFNIYTAHPGVSGYQEAIRRGIIDEYRVDLGVLHGEPVGIPTICKELSRAELHYLKAEAYIKFYRKKGDKKYMPLIKAYEEELERLGQHVN